MLPPLDRERFKQVGNAAETGTRLALVSLEKRMEAAKTASHVSYIELATISDFNQKFAESSYFK